MIPQDITFDSYYKKDSPNLKKHLENYEVIIKNNMKNPGICKINDEKIIKKINSLQIKYCSRAVYSIDDEFNDSNGEIKEWIKEDIDKFNNELRTQISEIKTNLDGHLYMQKKL